MTPGRVNPLALSLCSLFLAVIAAVTTGCGSTPEQATGPPVDEELMAANRMARFAFGNGQYQQAASIYRRALERAYVRNDTVAIVDALYNLAVCLMEIGEYPEAIARVNQAKDELASRSAEIPPDLSLLEATVLYRSERLEASWAATEKILAARGALPPTIRAKTYFLRGLISEKRNDVAGMRDAIDNMGQPEDETVMADLAELRGRLAMIENQWNQAIGLLDEATLVRRENFDYRRMAVTLALSAEASEKSGRTEDAARRYLQAGRSAALRKDRLNARTWLTRSVRLFDQVGHDALSAESRSLLSIIDAGPQQTVPTGKTSTTDN